MPDESKPSDDQTTEATRPTRLDDSEVSPDALTYVHGEPSPLEKTLQQRVTRDKSQTSTDAHPGERRSKP